MTDLLQYVGTDVPYDTVGDDPLLEDSFAEIWSQIEADQEVYCTVNFTLLHQYPPTGK